jgi:hypothetical protein
MRSVRRLFAQDGTGFGLFLPISRLDDLRRIAAGATTALHQAQSLLVGLDYGGRSRTLV